MFSFDILGEIGKQERVSAALELSIEKYGYPYEPDNKKYSSTYTIFLKEVTDSMFLRIIDPEAYAKKARNELKDAHLKLISDNSSDRHGFRTAVRIRLLFTELVYNEYNVLSKAFHKAEDIEGHTEIVKSYEHHKKMFKVIYDTKKKQEDDAEDLFKD